MMRAEHDLTFRHYLDAQWAYLKHRKLAMLGFIAIYWLLPFVLLLSIGSMLWAAAYTSGGFRQIMWSRSMVLTLLPPVVLALVLWPLRYFAFRRGYLSIFPGKVPRRAVFWFNEVQFGSEVPGRSESRIHWTSIADYTEDTKIALLFVSKHRFVFVPKAVMNESDWSQLRVLATQTRNKSGSESI